MKNFINNRKKSLIVTASIVSILVISIYAYMLSGCVDTDNARVKIANSQIVSEVSGYVTAIHSKSDDLVHAKDVILEIDKQRYIFEDDRAKSDFEYFKSEYGRKLQLVKNSFISAEELNKAKHDFEIAQVNLAKANYNLEKSNVEAKANGILANFDLKVGDFIAENRPLFNIINKEDVWIEANFKETDIEHIQKGQEAEIILDTFPGKKWLAKVVSIAPAMGAEFSLLPAQNSSGNWIKVSQRITIRLEFEEKKGLSRLASGMSAEVTIKIR